MGVSTHDIPAGAPYATNQIPMPGVHASNVIRQTVSGSRRGRMIFFPSTAATAAEINANVTDQNIAGFASALIADSWEVVAVDNIVCNVPHPCTSSASGFNAVNSETNGAGSNGGARFRATQAHYWDHIKLYVNQNFGPLPTFITGYSWGAYAVLALALDRTSDFIGAVSRCGVPIWTSVPLCPDWVSGSFTNYDIGATDFNNITIPIHLSYSSNDIAIGTTNINQLTSIASNASGAGAPVTATEDGTADHGWFDAQTTDMMAWVNSVLDPNYPAVL